MHHGKTKVWNRAGAERGCKVDSEPSTEHGRSAERDMPPMEEETSTSPNMVGTISLQSAQTRHLCSPGWPIIIGGRESDVVFAGGLLAACPVTSVPTSSSSISTRNRFVFCCCANCVSASFLQQRHADVAVSMTCFHHRSACAVSGVLGGRGEVGARVLCAGLGVRDVTRHPETELFWLTHGDARNARSLNSPETHEGPDSSSLRWRWVGGGRMRHCLLFLKFIANAKLRDSRHEGRRS